MGAKAINFEFGTLYTSTYHIQRLRNFNKAKLNKYLFANGFRIGHGLLSLPNSSACVERILSKQNLIKTKLRTN